MDKHVIKTILCERLQLAKIPFLRQGNQIQTACASVMFQPQLLVLKKPGKAERQLPYHKVRISQLLWQLQQQPCANSRAEAGQTFVAPAHFDAPQHRLPA